MEEESREGGMEGIGMAGCVKSKLVKRQEDVVQRGLFLYHVGPFSISFFLFLTCKRYQKFLAEIIKPIFKEKQKKLNRRSSSFSTFEIN